MQKEWKVGQLAKMTGLTIRTLRYYDQIGLFSPSGHTVSGYRLYTESDFSRLQQILSLKELGLSLEQIKEVMTGKRMGLQDIVSLQMARLRETIRTQQKLLRELEHVAGLMHRNEPLTVETFTSLMQTMKSSQEKHWDEKKAGWNLYLDQLGAYLDNNPGEPGQGGNPNE
ncbi:MerR family transcriptional regulator [Paenibacillus sp. CC-CFT747]|nr:MerR family transcriptional regulator [Paenibacillus sp. CC-CFT747]